MDKRVTKTSVISILVTIAIIVLAMGADEWFGIDLGVFKWVILAVAIAVNSGVVASQATKAEKKSDIDKK